MPGFIATGTGQPPGFGPPQIQPTESPNIHVQMHDSLVIWYPMSEKLSLTASWNSIQEEAGKTLRIEERGGVWRWLLEPHTLSTR